MELIETTELALLEAAAVVAGPLVGAKVSLCKTAIDFDEDKTRADYDAVEANYAGYSDGTITWGVPSISTDGAVEVVGTVPAFRPTDGVTPNLIFAVFVHGADVVGPPAVLGALLMAASVEGDGIPMESPLNEIIIQVRYRPAAKSLVVILS